MHDGEKIVSGAESPAAADYREIPLLAGNDVRGIDRYISIAIRSLLFMKQTERVTDFVANSPSIPRVGAEFDELLPASHSNGSGKSATEARIFLDGDVICRRY